MAGVLTIHYGLMGSGKTLFAMNDVVLPAVRDHRPFFTNITGINLSAISWLTGVHPTMIKYYPVQKIHAHLAGNVDATLEPRNGFFIIDEIFHFIENEHAIVAYFVVVEIPDNILDVLNGIIFNHSRVYTRKP